MSESKSASAGPILVFGATGNVGKATLTALNADFPSVQIRAVVRDPQKAAEALKQFKNVQLVKGDMLSFDSLKSDRAELWSGVEVVYIVPPIEERTNAMKVTVRAAQLAKVKFIGLLSVEAADEDGIFGGQWGTVHEYIKATGIPYSFIRAPMFAENEWGNVDSIKGGGAIYNHQKADQEITIVNVANLGTAAAHVLVNWHKHKHTDYLITNHETTTYNKITQYLAKATGKEIKFVEAPESAVFQACRKMGMPDWQIEGVLELVRRAQKVKTAPSKDFHKITGKQPQPLSNVLDQIAGAIKSQ